MVVREADAAVELRVARQALLHARHADQDDAHAGAVEDVADELERRRLQALGLVDDHHLDEAVLVSPSDLHALAAELLLDAPADRDEAVGHGVAEAAQRAEHGGRVEDRARARQHSLHARVFGLADAPAFDQRLGFVPTGVAARRERLADAGGTEAQADVAVLAHGLGELDEAPVLPGDDERALARAHR